MTSKSSRYICLQVSGGFLDVKDFGIIQLECHWNVSVLRDSWIWKRFGSEQKRKSYTKISKTEETTLILRWPQYHVRYGDYARRKARESRDITKAQSLQVGEALRPIQVGLERSQRMDQRIFFWLWDNYLIVSKNILIRILYICPVSGSNCQLRLPT